MGKFSEGTGFIFMLGFFYFIQGLPYGLQMFYIPLVLRKSNITLAKISFMRLTTVPWMLKFLWAPVFDYYKRPVNLWIFSCLTGSLLIFLLLSLSAPNAVVVLSVCLVLLNFFSSVMDIAVDSLAIQNLDPKDLGLGNIGQAVGYKIGMLFSGGLLLHLYDVLKWESIFRILCLFYVVVTSIFWHKYFKRQCYPAKTQPTAYGQVNKDICFTNILQNIISVVHNMQNVTLVTFLLIYKLGEQGYLSMVPLYLTDKDLPITIVAKITGFNSIVSSIIGSTIAGLIISKSRWKSLITLKSTLVIRSILLFANVILIRFVILDSPLFILLQWLTSAISGMITTSTFTIMMETSQLLDKSMQASFYTFLATMEVLGKMLMTSLCGAIIQLIGYEHFFTACSIVNTLPLLLIWVLRETDLCQLHLSTIKKN